MMLVYVADHEMRLVLRPAGTGSWDEAGTEAGTGGGEDAGTGGWDEVGTGG